MKNFIISIGKAACYLILFLAAQYLVSAAYIYGSMAYYLIRDYRSLLDADPEMLTDLIQEITVQALGDQNIIYLVSVAITIVILLVFFRMRSKRLVKEVWAMPVKAVSLWPVVLLAVTFSLFVCLGLQFVPFPEQALDAYDEMYAMTNDYSPLAFFVTVLAAPMIEEIIYRGLIFTRLCRGMPALAAAILASTIFGFMHGTLVWAAYAFVASLMLIFVYTKYRSLYASILFHILFNLCGGYLILYVPSLGTVYDAAMAALFFVLSAILAYIIFRMPREKIDKPEAWVEKQ